MTSLLGIGALERYSIEFLVRKGGVVTSGGDETRDATQILLLRRVCAARFLLPLGNSALAGRFGEHSGLGERISAMACYFQMSGGLNLLCNPKTTPLASRSVVQFSEKTLSCPSFSPSQASVASILTDLNRPDSI